MIGIVIHNPPLEAVIAQELLMQLIESSNLDIKINQAVDILRLMNLTWPDNDTKKSVEEKVEEFYEDLPGKICYCLYQNKDLVGYAESIPVVIKIENSWLKVLGLGGLNVHPDWRGKGYGREIVEAVFIRIDNNEYPFCLFQTGIPYFYEKLGCKVIENKFINSSNQEDPFTNPFWDEYAMIYHATAQWPIGTVDLRREGF